MKPQISLKTNNYNYAGNHELSAYISYKMLNEKPIFDLRYKYNTSSLIT